MTNTYVHIRTLSLYHIRDACYVYACASAPSTLAVIKGHSKIRTSLSNALEDEITTISLTLVECTERLNEHVLHSRKKIYKKNIYFLLPEVTMLYVRYVGSFGDGDEYV